MIKRNRMRKSALSLKITLFLAAGVLAEHSLAEESNGNQTTIDKPGITASIQYLGEVFSIVTGGIETGTEYLHLVNTPVTLHLDQLVGLEGASIYLNSQWATGGSPTELAGDLQVISNSDAPNTWKIFEAYYQQYFLGDRLSVLAGLFDLNSEFDVIQRGGVFINSSFGIGPEFSQSGVNGPSIFPTTSLALRLQAQVHDNVLVRAAAFDGVAGDPDDPYGTNIILDENDGLLLTGEVEFLSEFLPGVRTAAGAWFYTEPTAPLTVPQDSTCISCTYRNKGAYILGEGTIWTDNNSDRDIGVFARYGMADNRVNQVVDYFGFGVVANSLFTGARDNTVGLGFAIARNSRRYQTAMSEAGEEVEGAEAAVELTATFSIHNNVSIQPDIQYIINPGTDARLDNALAVGLRLDVSL